MLIRELLEARVAPNPALLAQFEELIDDALREYGDFLDGNNDVDDIDELVELLNSYNDEEELPIEFHANHAPRKDPEEWLSASANWSREHGKSIDVFLHAKNLEGVYGPKTFKGVLMRILGHELIHFGQYDKLRPGVIDNYRSGHMKGTELAAKTGKTSDWMRSYLRDPHELMAYAHDLASELRDLDDPGASLRNPEAHRALLPSYDRYRRVFPVNSPQVRRLLKYAADYSKQ